MFDSGLRVRRGVPGGAAYSYTETFERADQVAATAKALAKTAHRSRVSQADVRGAAARVAAAHRTDLVRVSTVNVTGGARLTAVNPASGKRIAFTVKAVGGWAVVRAA